MINTNLSYEKQIAKKFMGKIDGGVFLDPIPEPNEEWQPYGGMSIEKAIPIIIDMIDSINQKQLKLQRRLIRRNQGK